MRHLAYALILILISSSYCSAFLGVSLRRGGTPHGSLTLYPSGAYDLVGTATISGANPFTITLPVSVKTATVDCAGAQGGSYGYTAHTGGLGARMNASISFTGGTDLTAIIGKHPLDNGLNGTLFGAYGGGSGGDGNDTAYDIRRGGGGSTSLAWSGAVKIEAGGGGGANWNTDGGGGQGFTDGTGSGNGSGSNGSGGGWHGGSSPGTTTTAAPGGTSNIVSPATGSYSPGAQSSGGYMTITW